MQNRQLTTSRLSLPVVSGADVTALQSGTLPSSLSWGTDYTPCAITSTARPTDTYFVRYGDAVPATLTKARRTRLHTDIG